ncbi:MAG TPA: O-antigen ligase family protein [Solirubrobacteraceae bacterium]|nr:O-antigen ligase family protein [Solirubrobacteraceae bacterium]
MSTALKEAGIVVAALLASAVVLAPLARARAAAMLGALVLTPVLLLAEIWDTPQLDPVRSRPALAVAGGVAALAAVALAAWAIDRRPVLLALGAVLALPFRIPIEAGGESANLLVPLYFVVAAGALAFAVPRLRGQRPAREDTTRGALEWLLLGAVVLYALQAAYSSDFGKALNQVVFFYVPFALLYALLAGLEWTSDLARRCLYVLVGLALAFSAVGFLEYATRTVLLNPEVVASNQFQTYFRVSSLFFDPNIYGRFLVVVMTALVAVLLWSARQRTLVLATAALAVLFGGLVLTLSQSSLAALLTGLVVLAALRWSAPWTLATVAGVAALAAATVFAFPSTVDVDLGSGESVDKATSGRVELLEGGVRLFADRPVLGWGSGSFTEEFRAAERVSGEQAADASHTIPVTVAAEQGALGLALYLALLGAAFLRLVRGARASPVRAAIAAAFAGLVVHTLLYAAFLEDPLAWTLLAAGTAFALRAPAEDDPAGEPSGDLEAGPAEA